MSTQGNKLTAIADAIREKEGSIDPITANDFPARIRAIETGVDTSDATATADDILASKTAYVDGQKVTGTIPSKSEKIWIPTTVDQTIVAGNYLAGTQIIKGDANLKPENIKEGISIFGVTGTHKGVPPGVYGVIWDGSSTTKWTRTDQSANFADPNPYVDGASSYGSPFDNLQPWAGMVRSTRDGGKMVAIPKFWYKLEKSGNGLKIQIADNQADGFSVSPAHMDRGDGKGERDIVYIGRYHCGSDYKSNSGQSPKSDLSRESFRRYIHNLGANIWQCDFVMRFTVWLLYLVEFADWDSQSTIGRGCGNNSSKQSMGYTDSMPYHTGTTKNSRTTYGLGTQYRNIEGLWDNKLDYIDGCYNNTDGFQIILNPSNFSDTNGGTNVGIPKSGFPIGFDIVNQAGFPMFIPSKNGGSNKMVSCDFWGFSNSDIAVSAGGSYIQTLNSGLFSINYERETSFSSNPPTSRIQELP